MIPTISFSKYCEESAKNNEELIRQHFTDEFDCIRKIIDLQGDIYQQYFWVFGLGGLVTIKPEQSLFATAFYKNLISVNTARSLLVSGFYGSSRIILRNIFEFLLISKYIGISSDFDLCKLWDQGQNISVQRAVFRKIDVKNKDVLSGFWSELCKYAHSMIYSQQTEVVLSRDSLDQIRLTIIFLKILIECNYHLLVNHTISSSVKYYAKTYGDISGVSELKVNIRTQLALNKKNLEDYPKDIIKTYKSKWIKI